MLCSKPYTQGVSSYGCGQCMPCRYNRRRLWTHRLMLEALVHPSASFVTLTYNDDCLPENNSVSVRELQLYLKRLRKNADINLRYYGVGEYGDFSQRPHYHLALFGLGLPHSAYIANAWPSGFCYVGDLTVHSAGYIAGYVTKKMTRKDDPRLHGRYPEFARMSLRPGIGSPSLGQVAAALQSKPGWDEITTTGDVPGMLRHGGSTLPLGRYLRSRLRKEMEFVNDKQSEEATYYQAQKMLSVYASYLTPEEAEAGNTKLVYGKLRYTENERQKTLAQINRTRIKASAKGMGI